MKLLGFVYRYVWNHKKGFLAWVGVIFLLIVLLLLFTNGSVKNDSIVVWYGDWVDPILALLTAAIAALIAYHGYQREALNSLPLRLNIHYILNDKYTMSCREAYLSGPDDIRNWSQSIGAQMCGSRLDFYPFLKQSGPKVLLDNGNVRIVYDVSIFLRSKPVPNSERGEGVDHAKFKILKDQNIYIVWEDNNPDSAGNDEILVEGYGDSPFAIPTKRDAEYKEYVNQDGSRRIFVLSEGSKISTIEISNYLGCDVSGS